MCGIKNCKIGQRLTQNTAKRTAIYFIWIINIASSPINYAEIMRHLLVIEWNLKMTMFLDQTTCITLNNASFEYISWVYMYVYLHLTMEWPRRKTGRPGCFSFMRFTCCIKSSLYRLKDVMWTRSPSLKPWPTAKHNTVHCTLYQSVSLTSEDVTHQTILIYLQVKYHSLCRIGDCWIQ